MEDLYSILGVSPDASAEVIKQRFRFLAQAYHPDKFGSEDHKRQAEEQFKKFSAAYEVLSNPEKRAKYDRERISSGTYHQRSYTHESRDNIPKESQRKKGVPINPKTKIKQLSLFWIGTSLTAICGLAIICLLSGVLNSQPAFPVNPSYTVSPAIAIASHTPKFFKTNKPPTIFPTFTSTLTPALTLVTFESQSIIINEKYSDTKWEIIVEKILITDSLKSPITGRIDKASGRFAIIFLNVTNRGLSQDSFVCVCGRLEIHDADGNVYQEHTFAPLSAQEIYGTDYGLDINPDTNAHILTVFDISKQSEFYIFKSSILSTSQSSGLFLAIP